MLRLITLAGILSLLIAQRSPAANPTTMTMDDLPNQPVNGLVHPTTGVQFGFTVNGANSTAARYAGGGPGALQFVQDPSIEGPTVGVLSIIFPTPMSSVGFGTARNTFSAVSVGATVSLFNSANALLGTTNLAFNPINSFAEAQFTYGGPAVKRFTVDFTTSANGDRFAFDNLTFLPVPEPISEALFLLGGIFLAATARRRVLPANANNK